MHDVVAKNADVLKKFNNFSMMTSKVVIQVYYFQCWKKWWDIYQQRFSKHYKTSIEKFHWFSSHWLWEKIWKKVESMLTMQRRIQCIMLKNWLHFCSVLKFEFFWIVSMILIDKQSKKWLCFACWMTLHTSMIQVTKTQDYWQMIFSIKELKVMINMIMKTNLISFGDWNVISLQL